MWAVDASGPLIPQILYYLEFFFPLLVNTRGRTVLIMTLFLLLHERSLPLFPYQAIFCTHGPISGTIREKGTIKTGVGRAEGVRRISWSCIQWRPIKLAHNFLNLAVLCSAKILHDDSVSWPTCLGRIVGLMVVGVSREDPLFPCLSVPTCVPLLEIT